MATFFRPGTLIVALSVALSLALSEGEARTTGAKSSKKTPKVSVRVRHGKSAPRQPARARARSRPVPAKPSAPAENDLMHRSELNRAYSLYDQAITERLSGNAELAASKMDEAYSVYQNYHGSIGSLEPIMLFDLARAAEEAGNFSLAKDSYQKCLRLKPGFCEAGIGLASLLVRRGEHALALVHARKLAETRPNDPRARMLLSVILSKTGFQDDARKEELAARQLLEGGALNKGVAPPAGTRVEEPGPGVSEAGEAVGAKESAETEDASETGGSAESAPDP